MAATSDFSFDPQLYLSPDQQDLLLNALTSNQASSKAAIGSTAGMPAIPTEFDATQVLNRGMFSQQDDLGLQMSPLGQNERSSSFEQDGSPFTYDFEADGSYDFDANEGELMIGEMPSGRNNESNSNGGHSKRKTSIDSQNSDDGRGKRHEGEERQPKKPGRKPLTSEPTTKRKAQNRAAQRAFRERKEKHLKDLETKVEDLEKVSESTSHENSLLKAQVDRLQTEIKEYRRRLQSSNTNASSIHSSSGSWGPSQNNSSTSFSFDFPTFSNSISNSVRANSASSTSTKYNSSIAGQMKNPQLNAGSPANAKSHNEPVKTSYTVQSPASQLKTPESIGVDDLFGPSVLDAAYANPTIDYMAFTGGRRNDSRMGSFNSSATRGNSVSSLDYSASPSASSLSQAGHISSTGTSPEPSALSPPSNKLDSGLNTINEEQVADHKGDGVPTALTEVALGGLSSPPTDFQALDWLSPQNGVALDPTLFGEYRDPSMDILAGNYDSFFTNEAFTLPDFETNPFNTQIPQEPIPQKTETTDTLDINPMVFPRGALNHNKIWDKISSMPDAEDIDIDSLCTELRAKAKCTESGLCVADADFHAAVEKVKKN